MAGTALDSSSSPRLSQTADEWLSPLPIISPVVSPTGNNTLYESLLADDNLPATELELGLPTPGLPNSPLTVKKSRGRPKKSTEALTSHSLGNQPTLNAVWKGKKRLRGTEDNLSGQNIIKKSHALSPTPDNRTPPLVLSPGTHPSASRSPLPTGSNHDMDHAHPTRSGDQFSILLAQLQLMREENKNRDERLAAELKADRERVDSQVRDIKAELTKKESQWSDLSHRVKSLEENNPAQLLIAQNNERLEAQLKTMQESIIKAAPASDAAPSEDRLRDLEHRLEMQDRASRKLNVIVKGLDVTPATAKEKSTQLLKEKFRIAKEPADIRLINPSAKAPAVLIRLNSWEEKLAILRAKKAALANTDIYIERDYTPMERTIETQLRLLAKSERAKNKEVALAYGKIRIDGVWHSWDALPDSVDPGSPSSSGPARQTSSAPKN